jgi:pyruvate ferredoxin oxidoreductase alpha subunit
VAAQFADTFGRRHDALDTYRCDDAEFLFVMMGSFATKAREAVDRLREAGWRIGLLRPRLLRPLPVEHLRRVLSGRRAVAVIDQNLATGFGGVLHGEVASALYGHPAAPPVLASFVGGLGGRDIAAEEFYEMARVIREAAERGETLPPRLLYTREELREMHKLQAVARVERDELEGKP